MPRQRLCPLIVIFNDYGRRAGASKILYTDGAGAEPEPDRKTYIPQALRADANCGRQVKPFMVGLGSCAVGQGLAGGRAVFNGTRGISGKCRK